MQQVSALGILATTQFNDVFSFLCLSVVKVKVNDVDCSLSIVDTCPNGEAKDVTNQLVQWPSRLRQFT
jgi:hypothetical protein